ncbi:MAG: VWA domain-containing protein [Acidobacteriota bacterium]|nr:VWA domain-containing protein [Acidobacteriota bacterium]
MLAVNLGLLPLVWAQDEPLLRVNVRLVRILATVKTAAGALVGTLNKDDFTVLDNGAPQKIAIFERRTEQPLSVALLVDNSGSTAKDLKYETDSVARFLRKLFGEGNARDSVALYSFNYQVVKQNHFTRNASSLEHSLKWLRGEAGTSLYDAIYLAAGELEQREGRRVMVIVTDGGDTTSSKDFHAALNAAQLADAVIYPILVVPITNDAGRNIGGENALTTISKGTGGRVFLPSLGAALDTAFADILRELRTQYLLAYYPQNTPLTANTFHRLEVQVNARVNPGELRVVARNGYYGEAEDAGASSGRVFIAPQENVPQKGKLQEH